MLEVLPMSCHFFKQGGLIGSAHTLRIICIGSHRITIHLTTGLRLLQATSPIVPILLLGLSIITHLGIEGSHPTHHAHILQPVILPKIVEDFEFGVFFLLGVFSEVQPE